MKCASGHPDVYLFTFVDWQSEMQISRLGVERQIETNIFCARNVLLHHHTKTQLWGNIVTLK